MIDFENNTIKLRQVKENEVSGVLSKLLIPGEEIIGVYKGVRDSVTFTNKRVVTVNVQGITGKKKDFTSLPYSKIQAFSVETAGIFDVDSELELYFSGIGRVKFEFSGFSDIVKIGQIIGSYVL